MDLPSKHVLDLSKRIGARGAGSDGEKAAASYVLRTMSKFDAEVDVETFSSWKSDQHAIIIIYLAAVLAYSAFQLSYVLSLALAAIAFLVFQMETYSWGVLSRLLPHSSASNIIGKVLPGQSPLQTVLVVANYDSAKSSPLGRHGLARAYRVLYIISFVCITLIGLLAIAGLGASLLKISEDVIFLIWLSFAPFPAYLLALSVLMLWGESRGLYTAGANDNASGVGVMLSVLDIISAHPLENTAVWGVATARGAAGGRGMVALLKRHRRTLKDAFIINLDHVGRGATRVITREGAMLGFRASRKLTRLTLKAARESVGLKVGKGKCRVKKSDAMVSRARGYRSLTIGGTRGGAYEGWHNDGDSFDSIQRSSLDNAAKLVRLLLDQIDIIPDGSRKASERKLRGTELEDRGEESESIAP